LFKELPFCAGISLGTLIESVTNLQSGPRIFACSIFKKNREALLSATFVLRALNSFSALIFLGYDPTTYMHIPTVWKLMTSKSKDMYCIAKQNSVLFKYSWEAKKIIVDFEKSFKLQ
ncbi:hypothetical protein MXB_4283, partial [Myxobolus squamalis]